MGILTTLRSVVSGGPVYIKIQKDLLALRNAQNGKYIDEKPVIAVDTEKPHSIIAVGKDAEYEARNKSNSYKIFEPFNHPRVIIDDFVLAEKILMHLIEKLYAVKYIRAAPIIVLHPMDHYEGNLTSIEIRAIKELGAGIGGREVFIWSGRGLTDSELLDGSFKESEGILNTEIKWE